MRHGNSGRKLSRNAAHRDALFANMVTSLFTYGRIETTEAKAKELRSFADATIRWGIDVAAASYCYCNQMIAVRDAGIQVTHARGSGYERAEADRQMRDFISQLPPDLQRQVAILYRAISLNRRRLRQESAGP